MRKNFKKFILDQKNWKLILIIQFTLIFFLPFIIYPIYEKILSNVYEETFPDTDSTLILKMIKTSIFIHIWLKQIGDFFLRTLLLSTILFVGIMFFELGSGVKYKDIVFFVVEAELILILGNYITIFYNHLIQYYQAGELKFLDTPLNLSYYFSKINSNSTVFTILNYINIFTLLYFLVIYFLLDKITITTDKTILISLTFFGFLSFLILKILSPMNFYLSNRNTLGY